MTIYKPVKIMAYKCIEFAFDILSSNVQNADAYTYNGRIDVPTYLFDPVIVDKNNMEATVVKDGFITMEEIMN